MSSAQFAIAFILGGGAGTAVFFHAEKHHIRHPSAWASFVFLFLILGLPLYAAPCVRRLKRSRRL